MPTTPELEVAVIGVDETRPDLSEEELELLAEKLKEDQRVRQELMDTLANSIQTKFIKRASNRSIKENQWLRSARLYHGKLAVTDKYTKGETPWERGVYSDRPDVNIVRNKCSIAISQTVSMQFGTSNKNWDIFPDKSDRTVEGAEGCALMSDEIDSQLEKSKYSYQCRKAMEDWVVLGTGILKGPLSVGKLTRSYSKLDDTNVWIPSIAVDRTPTIHRVNPWFFYPDDTTNNIHCLVDTIEVHPLSSVELKKYREHDGFKREQIEEVLSEKPQEYYDSNWNEFARISESNPNLYKDKYLVLEYHGPINRDHLEKLNIEPMYSSVNDEYYGEVWVCQGKIIRLELEDIEASFRVPYYIAVWEKDPGSVFGWGVPLMMEDAQRVVNESWHMILDNCSASSGPQVAMQKHLIEPANGKWELNPGQIWYLNDPQATVAQAIEFFNIPNVTENIIPIMQMAQRFAEEESGIPLITAGLQSPQVTDTATGSAIMQHASTTLLDFMSEEWDDNITAPIIEAFYAWNMQHNPKPEIKGAYCIDVRTSTEYKNKQLYLRDLEKLSVEAAQNPELQKRIDMGQLARMRIEMMNLPSKAVIKPEDQVQAEEEEAAANAGPPPEIMELQLKARTLSLEEAKLQFEMQQQQQRELWEHEEKMTANQARLVESQARVAVSQNEKETEIIKLAQKDKQHADAIQSKERIATQNNQTKAFLTGLEETRKQQEMELFDKEIELKKEKGTGI